MLGRWIQELLNRRVLHSAAAYLGTALVIQRLADSFSGLFGLTDVFEKTLAFFLALFFLPAMVWVWRQGSVKPGKIATEQQGDAPIEVVDDGLTMDVTFDAQSIRRLLMIVVLILFLTIIALLVDRLVPDQEPTARVESEQPVSDEEGHAAPERSIAVLPFVNMSSDPEQEYFSDGISEELLNLLAKIPQFQVAGRTSSFKFKGRNDDLRLIGKSLGVMNILEGSVRKNGDRIRITAQLIRVDSGFHLWSETYDRDLTDIFAVQDEIAAAVVNELKITLLGAEGLATSNHAQISDVEAYTSYLQGLFYMNRLGPDNSVKAAEAFQRAVDLAPDSALAWAGLADAKTRYAGQAGEDKLKLITQGRNALATALTLDTEVPEVYLVQAKIAFNYDWDWPAAEEAIQKALALRPGDVAALRGKANLAATLGRTAEALAIYRDLIVRDPLDGTLPFGFITKLILESEFDEAEAVVRGLLEKNPHRNSANAFLSEVLMESGKLEEAMVYARQEPLDYSRLNAVGILEYKLGNTAAGVAVQQELLQKYGDAASFQQAMVAAASGDAAKTMEWLERAYQTRDPGLVVVKTKRDFLYLHDDPRFIALLEKMNLLAVSKTGI